MDPETSARDRLEHMLLDESAEPIDLPLSLLEDITENFAGNLEIGRGGSSVVYKGVLQNGTIAVKKLLDSSNLDDIKFAREVGCLMRMKHKNIVRFLGFCSDTQGKVWSIHEKHGVAEERQRVLCFEYVPRGSLDHHITDVSLGLEWRMRYKIIRGICEGLRYLHENHIAHQNLKPGNVLLDDNMVPKICDFETNGYVGPEFVDYGVIPFKSDIYALGVIIVEIVTGKKGYPSVVNVLEGWRNRLGVSKEDTQLQQIEGCLKICIRCMDSTPNKRPTIYDIIELLNKIESFVDIMEILFNDTENMDEPTKDGMSTLLLEEKPSHGIHQDTPTMSGVESSKNMEFNILELIIAGSEEPRHLDLPLLQEITENFSEKKKIGVGGCGDVYKGTLQNGIVAVKRLFKSRTIKDKMFHREVKSLITVRHHNIVRFLGYCSFTEEQLVSFKGVTMMIDVRERLLCFEYISNGSLESYLTDELRGLEWLTRYEVIVGICKGLLYLHKEKDIIHMDLKPANILLDDDLVPKITDFGLARLDNSSQTTTASRLISIGYCAPEYLLHGESSSKSDIYSLGVIIAEVVTGNKKQPNIRKALRRWRHRWMRTATQTPLCYQQVTKCLELAQRCTQLDPTGRPDISDIIDELKKIDGEADQIQVIPNLEDMLRIEPLEIHFPFELDQQMSHTIELTNDTDDCFAFNAKTSLRRLRIEPEKGFVTPRSKCSVTITMTQVQVMAMALQDDQSKEVITILSTRVDGGLHDKDITEAMFFEKEGKVVDEVNVTVVLDSPPLTEES